MSRDQETKRKHLEGMADMIDSAMPKSTDYRDLAYLVPSQGPKYLGEPNKSFTSHFCAELSTALREYADTFPGQVSDEFGEVDPPAEETPT